LKLAVLKRKMVKLGRLLRALRPAPRPGGVSVVMVLAYDWELGIEALRRCYPIADEILVGLDADRISWAGRPYPFKEKAFRRAIRSVDPQGKIRVLEQNFHAQGGPAVNETHERNALSLACRPGNWVLQIDADEWMMNPLEFRRWLAGLRVERELMARWCIVYKVIGRTALVVDTDRDWTCMGGGRRGAHWQRRETGSWRVRSPLALLHFSWGLSEPELRRKLSNWGHSHEIDVPAALKAWRSVTLKNYRGFKNFHPLEPTLWPGLKAVPLDRLEAWVRGRGDGRAVKRGSD